MIGDNIFDTAMNAQNTAVNTYGNMAQSSYLDYMNPYIDDVIDRTRNDMEQSRQMAMNSLGQEANAAGAFGGSRQGIQNALLSSEYDKNFGDIAAKARQQGFDRANQFAQNAQSTGASGLTGLGSQMFGQGLTGMREQQRLSDSARRDEQQLLDAARAETLSKLGYPEEALAIYAGLFNTLPSDTVVEGEKPGLFDILTSIGSLPAGYSLFG
tara:strand:+ start:2812 stop:3447 length:636 start_codon:yes stop_codon:yes gene_type:complete